MSECCIRDCVELAEYTPTLILHAKGHRPDEYEPAKAAVNAGFCRYHSSSTTAYEILSEEAWTRICIEFYRSNRVQPDQENVGIEWAKIGDRDTSVEVLPFA